MKNRNEHSLIRGGEIRYEIIFEKFWKKLKGNFGVIFEKVQQHSKKVLEEYENILKYF